MIWTFIVSFGQNAHNRNDVIPVFDRHVQRQRVIVLCKHPVFFWLIRPKYRLAKVITILRSDFTDVHARNRTTLHDGMFRQTVTCVP